MLKKLLIVIIIGLVVSTINVNADPPPVTNDFSVTIDCLAPFFLPINGSGQISVVADGLTHSVTGVISKFSLWGDGQKNWEIRVKEWPTQIASGGGYVYLTSHLFLNDEDPNTIISVEVNTDYPINLIGTSCNATAEVQIIAYEVRADENVIGGITHDFVYRLEVVAQ
jgi:hypothetical protein